LPTLATSTAAGVLVVRHDAAVTHADVKMQINGDTANSYFFDYVSRTGAVVASAHTTGANFILVGHPRARTSSRARRERPRS
jgi:hypothetical protein